MNEKIALMIICCIPALAIIIIAGVTIGFVLWKKWQTKKNAAQNQTPPPPPPTPKAKKGYGWLWWLIGAVLAVITAVVLTWGFSTSWGNSKQAITVTNSGTQVVIPKEKWTFRWITPLKSQGLSVEITENRGGIFKAVLHDTNGHGNDERVAGLTMRWEGENLLGIWTDYADGEGGNAYLYKASSNLWSGWWECNNGVTKVHIEMKKE